jgi:glycerol-3-phosphate dehydrogenase (NAD(P)+)
MNIAVLGAGSWGTAMALMMARNGNQVSLWGHDPAHVARLSQDRCNAEFLPGFEFPDSLHLNADLSALLQSHQIIMLAVPSHAFRDTLLKCKPHLQPDTLVSWITKGFETGSGLLTHEVVGDVLGTDTRMALVSGPSFALEVADNLPTAVSVASPKLAEAEAFATALHTPYFRAYPTDDIASVEIGGSLKNVLAIAAGIADGLGFGANTRAALITRGLAEMIRLGEHYGCLPQSFLGLAGVGDLVLTCTDNKSRNRRLGLKLGEGQDMAAAIKEIGQEVEGVHAAREAHQISQKFDIEMPICEQTYQVLHQNLAPAEAVDRLLMREVRIG